MDKLLATLNEYLAAAKGVLVQYGPEVWAATLKLIQFNAIWHLILGALALVLLIFSVKSFLKHLKEIGECPYSEEGGHVPYLIGGGVLSFVCVCAICCTLFRFDYWLGAFYPEGAVLYALAEKAGLIN